MVFKTHRFFPQFLLCLGMLVSISASTWGQTAPEGFTALFNGKDLSGWAAMETDNPRNFAALSEDEKKSAFKAAAEPTKKFWRVEEGEIVNDGKGPYLTTLKNFRDYELLIEYKTVAKADSGIYLKATPQVQICLLYTSPSPRDS